MTTANRPIVRIVLVGVILAAGVASVRASSSQAAAAAAVTRLYGTAERLLREGDADAAIEELQTLVRDYPTSELADEALLMIAEVELDRGDTVSAAEAAERVINDYPRSETTAGAEVITIEIMLQTAAEADALEEARARFARIPVTYPTEEFPDLRWRSRALVQLGDLQAMMGQREAAAGTYLQALEDEFPSYWTTVAGAGLGEVLLRQGEWVAAADAFQAVLQRLEGDDGAIGAADAIARAQRGLSMIYRFHIAPTTGRPLWTQSNRLVVTGTSLDRPVGVAANARGRLLIADEGVPLIGIFDSAGVLQQRLPSSDTRFPWWGADGRPYHMTQRSSIKLQNSRRVTFMQTGREVDNLIAGFTTVLGDWYILDRDDRRVMTFDADARYTGTILDSRTAEAVDLTGLPNGDVFVLDEESNVVLRRSEADANWQPVARGSWDRPQALAVDWLGNLYVVDRNAKRVHVYSSEGGELAVLGPSLPGGGQLGSPRDVSVDGSGKIYVADRDQQAVWVIQ